MSATILPISPEASARITELIPIANMAAAVVEHGDQSRLSQVLSILPAGILAVENANNVVESVVKEDFCTAVVAGGIAALGAGVAIRNIATLRSSERQASPWSKKDMITTGVAMVGLSLAQRYVNQRQGK
jgi:hypothetical protein